ncbi:MAG: DUF6517 family protein [Haloferacaceae archaeon]
MNRRDVLAATGAVLTTATAGCTSLLSDEPITFEADPATVRESVVEVAGYELEGTDSQVLERTFEAAGESQTVEVTNRIATYEKGVDLGPLGELRAATFTVVSTPQVEVLGRTFNPVDDMSSEDLAERIQEQYEEIGDLEVEHEAPVTILGTETTQTKFAGEIRLESGDRIDIYLHASDAVASGDDFVLGIGGYPQRLPGEEDRIMAMMEGIEHGGE